MPPSSFWAKQFGFPNMRENPDKWNEGCEKLISLGLFGMRRHALTAFECLGEKDLQEFYSNHRDRVAGLCNFQQNLTKEASASFAKKDLEKKWLEAGMSTRRYHMLEGLVRACPVPRCEDERLRSELTLDSLEKGHGQSFITLLQSCMLEDASFSPSTPILLPTSKWTFTPSPTDPDDWKEEAAYAFHNLSRTIFICQFLYHTLASFYQAPRSSAKQSKGAARNHLGNDTKKMMDFVFGPEASKAMQKEEAALRKARVATCELCRQDEEKGSKFMICKACKENLDRRVFYCSVECQKADWKPRHKAICGKPMTLTNAQSSANPKVDPNYQYPWDDPVLSLEKIGPAVNNYKRSPALVYQIYAIQKHPALDYVFFLPSDEIYPMILEDVDIVTRFFFRQCREEAMTTGDHSAIAKLGEFLTYTLSPSTTGPTRQDIMKQLSNEYGFDVNGAVLALDKKRANDPRGLTMLGREREEFSNMTKNLLHNPDLAEAVFGQVAQGLRKMK